MFKHLNDKTLAYIKLILVIVVLGSGFHVAKYLVKEVDASLVAFVRFFIASIILLCLSIKNKSLITKISNKQILLLILTGVMGVFLYNICFFTAETLIPGNDIVILMAFTPCITVILSRIFLRHKLPFTGYLGIIIALFGTILIIRLNAPVPQENKDLIIWDAIHKISSGQLLALAGAFLLAAYSIFNRALFESGLNTLTVTTYSNILGCILLFFTSLKCTHSYALLFTQPLSFWCGMLYLAVLGTAFGYVWYAEAIAKIGVGQTAVFLNGMPVIAVIVGVFIGKSITFGAALSGLIIILGVVITNYAVGKPHMQISQKC